MTGRGCCARMAGFSTTLGGAFIPDFLNGAVQFGELDNQTTNTNAYGASAQVTNTNELFGLQEPLRRRLQLRRRADHVQCSIVRRRPDTADRVFVGPGVVIDEPGANSPVRVGISNATYGLYLADTLNLTPAPCTDAVRPVQRGAGRSERPERRRSDRQSQLYAFQPRSRPDLSVRAMAHCLCRLCRGQPCTDAGRTVLRRSNQLLQPGQLLRRRSGPAAGRVAHCRGRLAWLRRGLRGRSAQLQPGAVPQQPRQRYRLHQQCHRRAAPSSPTSARRGVRGSMSACN